jgi:sulfur relay (sulfurtransferase) complex TusBCD TusD component (DsrE family)
MNLFLGSSQSDLQLPFARTGARHLIHFLWSVSFALAICWSGISAQGQESVTLAWDPSASGCAGYRLYSGPSSTVYTKVIDVGLLTTKTVSELSPGETYYFAVTAYSADGAESDFSNEISYTVPSQGLPRIALNSGLSILGSALPAVKLDATVTPNGHNITAVRFYSGSTLLAQVAKPPYTWIWNNVLAGHYNLTAQITYNNGKSITSSLSSVNVPKPAPALALTSPAHGTFYPAAATIPLAATVTTNGHIITKVQFYNGTTLLAQATAPPYAWIWRSVPAGQYNLKAVLTYDSGLVLASSISTVNITNPPPLLALTAPANGNFYTAPAAIPMSATVTANGHAITKVEFFNGTLLLGQTNAFPYVWNWKNVAAGQYNLSARLTYNSGKITTSCIARVTVTNPPPIFALSSPRNDSYYSSPATIPLNATVTANGQSITKVQFFNGSTFLAQANAAPYAWSWKNAPVGRHNVSAQLTYGSGRIMTSSIARVIITDRPPALALASPQNGSYYRAPVTIPLSAVVTTNGHTITKVQFFNGGVMLGQTNTPPYAYAWKNVAAGQYNVSAQLTYDSGLVLTSSVARIDITNPPPILAFTSPRDDSYYSATSPVPLLATVTTNGHAIREVRFLNGGTLLARMNVPPYAYPWKVTTPGQYHLRAQLTYDSGQVMTSSVVRVNITDRAPVLSLVTPQPGIYLTAPADIPLFATVTTNGHKITRVQFYNGATLLAQTNVPPYVGSWPNVAAGQYNVTAQLLYDNGSVLTSYVARVTVTNPPPIVALAIPQEDTYYTAPASIPLAAAVVTNGHTITKVQFLNGTTLIAQTNAPPYVGTWKNVTAGQYNVTAQLFYNNGSVIASPIAKVTVTNPPPVLALGAPRNGAVYTAPASIPLAATVTTNGHAITKVRFFSGTTLLAQADAPPYTGTWKNVGAGQYNVSAQLTYDSGKIMAGPIVSVKVTNPPPAIALTTTGSAVAPATLVLNAVLNLNGNTVNKVQFYNESILLGEKLAPPYTLTWPDLNAGNYKVSARLIYNGGSVAESSEINLEVTQPPPAITLSAPTDGQGYTAPAAINLVAMVTANGRTVTNIQFFSESLLLASLTEPPYEWVWNDVPIGEYHLSAQLTDNTGITVGSPVVTVTITNLLPEIALDLPTDYVAPATIMLQAAVKPNGNSIAKVQFFYGALLLGETATEPYRVAWNNVHAGTYTVSSRLVYNGSNFLDSASMVLQVTGAPPSIALTSPVDNARFTSQAVISLAASVSPNGHEVSRVEFYNGTNLLGECNTLPYTYSWSGVGIGNYALRAQLIYDADQAVVSDPATISVTLPPPWETMDIGEVGEPGNVIIDDNGYTVSGSGNISGTQDNFRFLYQPLTNYGIISAQISALLDTGPNTAVGLMVRDDLSSGSKYVMLRFSPDRLVRWQTRNTKDGPTFTQNAGTAAAPYCWGSLIYTEGTVYAMLSKNNENWALASYSQTRFSSHSYIGLAVASGSTNLLNTTTFSNLSFTVP